MGDSAPDHSVDAEELSECPHRAAPNQARSAERVQTATPRTVISSPRRATDASSPPIFPARREPFQRRRKERRGASFDRTPRSIATHVLSVKPNP